VRFKTMLRQCRPPIWNSCAVVVVVVIVAAAATVAVVQLSDVAAAAGTAAVIEVAAIVEVPAALIAVAHRAAIGAAHLRALTVAAIAAPGVLTGAAIAAPGVLTVAAIAAPGVLTVAAIAVPGVAIANPRGGQTGAMSELPDAAKAGTINGAGITANIASVAMADATGIAATGMDIIILAGGMHRHGGSMRWRAPITTTIMKTAMPTMTMPMCAGV
jgi:hypothetical protein